ncbi:ANTAR domain-containing response regulator [Urinicoccus massiliensis]|uniref:ANTAR domain-containing response regulator n=1 Tax=Urinicoccus massiliensis TaxID=1723382 RepID=UPI00092FDA5A|nr:response regulator [Urinicoccus massiliensis]
METTVVVAEDELITRMDLAEILKGAGYKVVGMAKDGLDAIEICRREKPNLAIMDVKMPVMDGLEAIKIIQKEKIAGCIVLLTAFSDNEYIEKARDLGVMTYMVKPFDESTLIPAIKVALAKQREMDKIQDELEVISKKLDDRKFVERAKGILMKKHHFSEDQAYKTLRKLAMDKRMSISEISRLLIDSIKD